MIQRDITDPIDETLILQIKFTCLKKTSSMVFYVVTRGRETGVFENWETVAPLVNGYRNARFRKFSDSQTAQTEYDKNIRPKPKPSRKRKLSPVIAGLHKLQKIEKCKPAYLDKTGHMITPRGRKIVYISARTDPYGNSEKPGSGIGMYWGPEKTFSAENDVTKNPEFQDFRSGYFKLLFLIILI